MQVPIFDLNLTISLNNNYKTRQIFAINSYNNGFFNEVEWHMYNEWIAYLGKNMFPQIQGIVYLQTTPEICLKRTQKRGRMGEDKIPLDYFKQLHQLHENWIKDEERRKKIKVLRLNLDKEFENNEEYQKKLLDSMKVFLEILLKNN